MKNKLLKLVEQFGATFEELRYPDSVDIVISAPDGMQWTDGECLNMVETYYPYIKGDREEAIKTICQRLGSGLEVINEELNPQ